MTFWGIELKEGKLITLKFPKAKGRLRVTKACLGHDSYPNMDAKILIECSVQGQTPIVLCSLEKPGKRNMCPLDIEFGEDDGEVCFSVSGCKFKESVHLSGYLIESNGLGIILGSSPKVYQPPSSTKLAKGGTFKAWVGPLKEP
ncbi:hypothetical protein MKX03_026942 [Papaver bracteatum]|nr:hypothetical protein MKX03_026942 [Papaver bracteatum]